MGIGVLIAILVVAFVGAYTIILLGAWKKRTPINAVFNPASYGILETSNHSTECKDGSSGKEQTKVHED